MTGILKIWLIAGIILVVFSGLIYLLGALGIYEFDPQMTNTLLALLIIGSASTLGSILYWIYVQRRLPGTISRAISRQQHIIDTMKSDSEEIGADITSIKRDISELTKNTLEMGERNREELKSGEQK